jgi:phage major head subunit gpT-like protein
LAKSLAEYSMTLENKEYEGTLEVFRKDLRRDKTSQLMPKVQGLARRAAEHDEKLLSAIIDVCEAGTVSTSYDGQYFVDTDHSIGSSGTFDNDITYAAATGTSPTTTEASGAIMAAVQALYAAKDDQGEPVNQNLTDFLVMVPTSYWAVHQTAVTKENLASSADNPLVGSGLSVRVVVNPRLTWTTKILVLATGGTTKPFLIQTEEAPVMEVIGEGSERAFMTGSHLYGVRKSGNVAYWDYTKACMVTYT